MMQEGLVLRTTGSWYRVLAETHSIDCRLRGNYRLRGNKQTNPVAVGDRVRFELQDDGTGVIHEVKDRTNYIVRRATKLSKQTHVIAANIDLLCIVATLGLPRTSTGFIDRLLVTAEAYHIPAAILFNKCDLLDSCSPEAGELSHDPLSPSSCSPEAGELSRGPLSPSSCSPEAGELSEGLRGMQHKLSSLYRSIGYPVLEVSALRGDGLDEVKRLIAGKTVLFSGHSGVGKSALLNALCPGLDLRTGDLSDWSLKGKHTTTFAEIHPIRVMGYGLEVMDACAVQPRQPSITHNPSPITYLIDTPGIKEFGMVDFNAQELSHFFPEMRAVLHDCRFANCTHSHEPGCAVMAAVEDGRIPEERYRNYLNILEDINNPQNL